MASARARGLCSSVLTAKARPQGWGWPWPPRRCWGQHPPCPIRAHPGSKILPGGIRTRLTLSVGSGFAPTTPGLAQAEDLGHEGLWDTKSPKMGAERENRRERHRRSAGCRGCGGSRGREEAMDAPTPRGSGISATPNSPPGSGVSPRQGPNTHLHPVGFLHGFPTNWSHFHLLFPSPLLIRICVSLVYQSGA